MTSPVKLYQREMHENVGFFATWFPADAIRIGEAGVFEGGRFRVMSSLEELGIPCEIAKSPTAQDVRYTSSSGTRIEASGGADVASAAAVEIKIEFSKAGAFIFHANQLRSYAVSKRATLGGALVDAHKEGRWDQDWLVVDGIHQATNATIVVSEDRSAGLVLEARVQGVVSGVSLADPELEVNVVSTRGQVMHVVSGKGLTPLYSCLRLKAPLFGDPSVRAVRGPGDAGRLTALTRPGIEDLLES